MQPHGTSRRLFLKAAATTAGLVIVPANVLGGIGKTPPSEQLTKALIGTGGMGRGHIRGINPTSRLLAICDTDTGHIAEAKKTAPADVKVFADFRELLDLKEVDIVHIATPPHWHGLMSIAAANAGKDIWCEKPMTRTIGEGIRVMEAVQRNGRIFRLNTWFRFEGGMYGMGVACKPVKKAVAARLLGWPIRAVIGAHQGFDWKLHGWKGQWNLKPQTPPANLDYDMWLGPAPYKPYHPHRVHGSFRGYWDYDGGGLGDMGQHYIDPTQYILEKDDTSPVEIEVETPPQHPDAVVPWTRVTLKYADGCEIVLDGDNSMVGVPYLSGPRGTISQGLKSNIPNLAEIVNTLPDPEPMLTDFVQAVKTRRKFALNEQNGFRSCTIVNLALAAVRLGRGLKFDPVKLQFVNDDEANRLIFQPMGAPWHL